MQNNFYYDKHPIRIKLNCLKKGLSHQFTQKQQNDGWHQVTNGPWYEREIFSKYFFDPAEQLYNDNIAKNQVKVPKKGLILKITNKLHNYAATWRYKSKRGHNMKEKFFSKCYSDQADQLLPW